MYPDHIPTIAEKVVVKDGSTVYGVICAQCSDNAEDYIRCEFMSNYPKELVEKDEQ